MKCDGCGADLAEGVKHCPSGGREVGLGQRVGETSERVVKETGEVAGKTGKAVWSGAKGFGKGLKKGGNGSEGEKKE